jgi:putative ABC transport system permease protein
MWSVYRTLSTRYLRERWTRALLIIASIALGVATLVATFSLNETMNKAVRTTANPLAGGADLTVTNGDRPIAKSLGDALAEVRGVRSVRPLLFTNVHLLDLKEDRSVLLAGVDLAVVKAMKDNPWGIKPEIWHTYTALMAVATDKFCIVGEELNTELDKVLADRAVPVRIQGTAQKKGKIIRLTRVGTVTADGPAAALGGNVLVTTIENAAQVLGQSRDLVTRLDLTLGPGYDRERVRRRVQERLARLGSPALVKTPEEQHHSSQKAMAGMQAGFALCGLGALVVGMFLVYNALSVSVTERRHEIGILRSLGATRGQIRALFAGEAVLLGLAGAIVGVPLGLGLAYLALEPMKGVISQIFRALEANRVEWTVETVTIATGAGMVTALLASLVPAFRASWEEPAVAVRRVPENPTWRYRFVQLAGSGLLGLAGGSFILLRDQVPQRVGTYGGLLLVLLGALLATPLLAAVASRLIQPVARRYFGIEGRLAADNLVRAPARTGLVIAAVAAGVSLVMQTAGTLRSNRDAVRDWVERYIAADLVVTAGSPVSAGGQGELMDPRLGAQIERVNQRAIRGTIPIRFRRPTYADNEILLIALPARRFYDIDRDHTRKVPDLDLYLQMSRQPGTALISENFAALYGVAPGDVIELSGVQVHVLGKVRDYSWNLGTVIMDWDDYRRHFKYADPKVDVFDVYLRGVADAKPIQTRIGRAFGADKGLIVLTHDQLQQHIADVIDRLYAIAYGQQLVVGIVAALGVVTALLIAVLQRRREMGVLRAIGASQAQVVYSVLAEAALMGVIGTAIGLLVGVPLEWYILQVAILEESGYLFPVTIPWAEAGFIAVVALLTATLAGLGPALHAVRQRIPEAIAHE